MKPSVVYVHIGSRVPQVSRLPYLPLPTVPSRRQVVKFPLPANRYSCVPKTCKVGPDVQLFCPPFFSTFPSSSCDTPQLGRISVLFILLATCSKAAATGNAKVSSADSLRRIVHRLAWSCGAPRLRVAAVLLTRPLHHLPSHSTYAYPHALRYPDALGIVMNSYLESAAHVQGPSPCRQRSLMM